MRSSYRFGPWATPLDIGAAVRLSGFWKQRMAMLSLAREATLAPSHRAALPLLLCVIAIASVPTLHLTLAANAATPAAATRPGDATRVELPGGGLVEIAGVAPYPSGGKNWWAADGTPTAAPYDEIEMAKRRFSSDTPWLLREIALRWLRALPPDAQFRLSVVNSNSVGRGALHDDRSGPHVQAFAAALPIDSTTATIRLRVIAGPWTTIRRNDGAFSTEDGLHQRFSFAGAVQAEGEIVFTVAHDIPEDDVRVIAIRHDGTSILPTTTMTGGGGAFRQTTSTFAGVAKNEIAEYQLQTRTAYLYEVRNVSLHAGHLTQPAIARIHPPQ